MGFLKNIAKKISNAIASLKSSGAQKILKKADINLENNTIKDNQLLGGQSNFDEKRYEFEDNATSHFVTFFKGKTLQEVADYVSDMRNFSSESEFVRQINTQNRRRATAGDSSRLSIDDLYKYFAGGSGLSEKDIASYRQIAAQTQAKARALSYIKSNFVGICNMRRYGSEADKKAFDTIMRVVKAYADKDINNFAVADFDPERINKTVLNSDNVYLKAVAYSEIRSREILEKRASDLYKTTEEVAKIASDIQKKSAEYDKTIDTIVKTNQTVVNKQKENKSLATLEEQLNKAHDEFADKTNAQKLSGLWIKGSRHSRGEKKAILDRQKQFISSFSSIARNFQLFGEYKGSSILIKHGDSFANVDEYNGEYDLFDVHGDITPNDYEKLASIIKNYNSDETTASNRFFTVKPSKDGSEKIYTTSQDKIMANIYQKLVDYAKETVNESTYTGNNPLKDFGYKGFRHSFNNDNLSQLSDALFTKGFNKDSTAPKYEELSGEQVDALYSFIVSNEPVKSFLTNDEVKTLEIDKILTDAINPESSENVASPDNCMLSSVMADMRIKAVETEIDRTRAMTTDNTNAISEAQEERNVLLEKARQLRTGVESTAKKIDNYEDADYAERDKVDEKVRSFVQKTRESISYYVDIDELPATAEELGTDETVAPKYNEPFTKDSTTYFPVTLLKNPQSMASDIQKQVVSDLARFDTMTMEQKADIYAKYYSSDDKEQIEEFIAQTEQIIESGKTTADYALDEERE